MGKVSGCIRITGLFALIAIVIGTGIAQTANAQSQSSRGINTGADIISSTVPEAGNIFSLHDEIDRSLKDVINCAKNNMLPDASGGCRGSKAPDVDFTTKPDVVMVQNPYPLQDDAPAEYSLKGEDATGYINVTSGSASCIMNWTDLRRKEQVVPHGDSIIAYETGEATKGAKCNAETRTCNNGRLSGSYTFNRCTGTSAEEDCIINWADLRRKEQVVPHGESVKAYETGEVAAGKKCNGEIRVCNDGDLSGKFIYNRCSVAAENCTINWADARSETVVHGDNVTAFLNGAVLSGSGRSCSDQVRTCDDGNLSGSYRYKNCEITDVCTINPSLPGCSGGGDDGTVQCLRVVPPECECGGSYRVPKGGDSCEADCNECDGGNGAL